MELLGEYVGPAGQLQRLRVSCVAPADADRFQGLLSGVSLMRERVAELFGQLGQRKAQDSVPAGQDEVLDGDDEDEEEDNNIDNRTISDGPSAKRPKPPS
ncbi:EKC/KEOPS complex subunit GON7 [Dasypus novemcinctus]|uniref:EKC/KEOPS complex subunit GON7 n=1 Tax=Dasypus novemcinctus TaxID=9361 RepID=UPI0003289CF0|nr:EKC/KEOPS complex subunit GON7 [Dasypus novemcinctus]